MRRILPLSLLLLFFFARPVQAQCPSGFALVQASKIINLNNVLLPSGNLSIIGIDANRKVINFSAPGGGAVTTIAVKSPVSNGSITQTVCVPRSDRASVYVRYHFTVTDNRASGTHATVVDAWDVPITSDVFSLDSYTYPANAYANPPNEFTSGHGNGDLTVTGTVYAGTIAGATAQNANHANTADTATSANTATTAQNAAPASTADNAATAITATSATNSAHANTAGTLSTTPSDYGNMAATGINPDGSPKSRIPTGSASAAGAQYELQAKGAGGSLTTSVYSDVQSVVTSLPMKTKAINGVGYSDLFSSIAAMFTDPFCATSGCVTQTPKNSTSSEGVPSVIPDNSVYQDARQGRFYYIGNVLHSDGRPYIGGLEQQFRTKLPQTSNSSGEATTHWRICSDNNYRGWNYGGGGGGWTVHKCERMQFFNYVRGISQARSTETFCFGSGDCAGGLGYHYVTFIPNNVDDSGEGITGLTSNMNQAPGIPVTTVGSGATTGNTILPTNIYTTWDRSAFVLDGGTVLDITKGVYGGQITGPASVIGTTGAQSQNTVGAAAFPVTGVAAGSAWAIATSDLPTVSNNPTAGATDTATINLQAGTFSPGMVCIMGSQFYEQAMITATAAGSLTIHHTAPHLASYHGIQTTFWQGGLCGQYYSSDLIYGLVPSNRQRTSYPIGGALDSTHFVFGYYSQGHPASGAPPYYSNPVHGSAVRTGNVVTFTADSATLQFNATPSITVSGCSDASFNGTVANLVADSIGKHYTYNQTGANASCSSLTLDYGSTYYNTFHLYPGAEVIAPLSTDADEALSISPNTVAWTPGDTITVTHGYAGRVTGATFSTSMDTQANATISAGVAVNIGGQGANQDFPYLNLRNGDPYGWFQGFGGWHTVPPVARIEGPHAGFFFINAPVPGHPLIYVGDYADGKNYNTVLLQTNHGAITNDFAANTMDISAPNGVTLNGNLPCLSTGINCPSHVAYTLKFNARPFNYPVNTPYYIGESEAINTNQHVYYTAPVACTIGLITASATVDDGTTIPVSSQTPAFFLDNVTTGTNIWNANWNSGWGYDQQTIWNSNVGSPQNQVHAGDHLRITIRPPTWTTAPTSVSVSATVYCVT